MNETIIIFPTTNDIIVSIDGGGGGGGGAILDNDNNNNNNNNDNNNNRDIKTITTIPRTNIHSSGVIVIRTNSTQSTRSISSRTRRVTVTSASSSFVSTTPSLLGHIAVLILLIVKTILTTSSTITTIEALSIVVPTARTRTTRTLSSSSLSSSLSMKRTCSTFLERHRCRRGGVSLKEARTLSSSSLVSSSSSILPSPITSCMMLSTNSHHLYHLHHHHHHHQRATTTSSSTTSLSSSTSSSASSSFTPKQLQYRKRQQQQQRPRTVLLRPIISSLTTKESVLSSSLSSTTTCRYQRMMSLYMMTDESQSHDDDEVEENGSNENNNDYTMMMIDNTTRITTTTTDVSTTSSSMSSSSSSNNVTSKQPNKTRSSSRSRYSTRSSTNNVTAAATTTTTPLPTITTSTSTSPPPEATTTRTERIVVREIYYDEDEHDDQYYYSSLPFNNKDNDDDNDKNIDLYDDTIHSSKTLPSKEERQQQQPPPIPPISTTTTTTGRVVVPELTLGGTDDDDDYYNESNNNNYYYYYYNTNNNDDWYNNQQQLSYTDNDFQQSSSMSMSSSTTTTSSSDGATTTTSSTSNSIINPFPFPSTIPTSTTKTTSSRTSSFNGRNSIPTPTFFTPDEEGKDDDNDDYNDDNINDDMIEKDGGDMTRTVVDSMDMDTSGSTITDTTTTTSPSSSPLSSSSSVIDNTQQQEQEGQVLYPFASILEPVVLTDSDTRRTTPTATTKLNNKEGPKKTSTKKNIDTNVDNVGIVVVPTISSDPINDTLDSLHVQLVRLEKEIYTMNNNKKFNINSPKQVSMVLFGRSDMSTDKSVLDGMAPSNIIAKLILQYRTIKQRLGRLTQQQQQEEEETKNNADDIHDPIMLMDTSSFIFRAYYSMPPMHRADDGMPVGAVLGFCNMLNRLVLDDLLKGGRPKLVLCCDAPVSPTDEYRTFRHELYSDYKGHRPALPVDLLPQFDLIQRAAQAYGLIQIQAVGYEADDVLATLSCQASEREGQPVQILSGDKDLMQLITRPQTTTTTTTKDEGIHTVTAPVEMVDPISSTTWTHDAVIDKWGVPPSQLGDVLALAGDTADNVPGVPGIGPKIAAQLVQEYGTLDDLLDKAHTIKQKGRREKLETYRDQALLSRRLVELKRDLQWDEMQLLYPHDTEFATLPSMTNDGENPRIDEYNDGRRPVTTTPKVSDLRMEPINVTRILKFYDEMGFYTIKQRLLERLARQPPIPYNGENDAAETSLYSAADPNESTDDKSSTQKTKRSWYVKKKMGIPKPEDYKDVPF